MEVYNTFNKEKHLRPDLEKEKFDTLHDWDLGWELLEPINIAKSKEDDRELSKRFSPGQKALYFFWYLDGQVTNGGFLQFYRNGYRDNLPTIKEGLKLVGDTELVDLVDKVEQEYLRNEVQNDLQIEKGTWEPDFTTVQRFDKFDDLYYKIHDKTMELIEKYARLHTEEFVKLK